jgi:hypothetical protein
LQKDVAETVARHLVAAGMLVDEDPAAALAHARYARRRASRIAVVREAAGIAAYHAGEWAEALAELRAARRMGGGSGHLPVIADIERAMGRPERAIELARDPEARELPRSAQIELAIVVAGARRDLDELDAAVVALQVPELEASRRDPWSARLFYAYADNLLAAGRESDALQWFVHAADADADGQTDADVRIADLTGEPLVDDGIEFALEEDAEGEPAALDSTTSDDPAADGATDDPADRESARADQPVDHAAVDAAENLACGAADHPVDEADGTESDDATAGSVHHVDNAVDQMANVRDSDATDLPVDHVSDDVADETAAHLADRPVDQAADNGADQATDVVDSDTTGRPVDDAADDATDEAIAHLADRPVDHVADTAVGNPPELEVDAADHGLGVTTDATAGEDDAPGPTALASGSEDTSAACQEESGSGSPTNGSAPHAAYAPSDVAPSDTAPSVAAPGDPEPSDVLPSDPAAASTRSGVDPR